MLARLDDSQCARAARARRGAARAARGVARTKIDSASARSASSTSIATRAAREGRRDRRRRSRHGEARGRLARQRDRMAAASEVEVARSQVAHPADQSVDDLAIRAPFAASPSRRTRSRARWCRPMSAGGGFTRTGICTIVDMSSLEIEVDVNESYINRVQPGQPVEAVLDAYPDWRIPRTSSRRSRPPTARRRRCWCASASTSSIRASCRTWA